MDEESAMRLCSLLMKADSEKTVITLLKEAGYWDDPTAWRFYGDRETNFNTIGNQQSRPGAGSARGWRKRQRPSASGRSGAPDARRFAPAAPPPRGPEILPESGTPSRRGVPASLRARRRDGRSSPTYTPPA